MRFLNLGVRYSLALFLIFIYAALCTLGVVRRTKINYRKRE